MAVLIDTSILARMADHADPDRLVAAGAVSKLRHKGEELFIARQNLYEYWTVVTRPVYANGLDLPPADALRDIEEFKQRYTIPTDPESLLDEWLKLVSVGPVIGKQSHDARVVALMICLSIPSILTFNTPHFARFPQVKAIHPSDVV